MSLSLVHAGLFCATLARSGFSGAMLPPSTRAGASAALRATEALGAGGCQRSSLGGFSGPSAVAALCTSLPVARTLARRRRLSRPSGRCAARRPTLCDDGDEICEFVEDQRSTQLEQENEVLRVSKAWAEGTWAADWGPEGPVGLGWATAMVPDADRRRSRKVPTRSDGFRFDDALTAQTVLRVVLPTVGAVFGGAAIYGPICLWLQDNLDIADTGRGPILQLLAVDQSQFMQNFLTVNGLLFTILCGNTYTSLYTQQEVLFQALFIEVSEAKSLLEQACLVCQGRPFYPKMLDAGTHKLARSDHRPRELVERQSRQETSLCKFSVFKGRRISDSLVSLDSIRDYVSTDLRRLDVEPAELLTNRPMDDPLEYILYATSVGVPSIIYDTIRDLRQARGQRLGAMQRKLPAIHFVLLYVLGILELMAFPLLGAGTFSMAPDEKILSIQALFFGAMSGAIVMTLQVIFELWKPFGGAYTVDTALSRMVAGLEEELRVRKALWQPNDAAPAPAAAAQWRDDYDYDPP
ncbi:unnamed protein product [Durusdinium trenchii]|uniref:Uncharacterized protein n=1 Tax=Durusdinium trenchii TaxID=1381693 RepID=A0ABP0M7L6_9DINO